MAKKYLAALKEAIKVLEEDTFAELQEAGAVAPGVLRAGCKTAMFLK